MNRLRTIGHSLHSIDFFVDILKNFQIDALVDVRSAPYSKFASSFNKDIIQSFLRQNNICYIYMGDLLGARYDNFNLLDKDGVVDFDLVFLEKNFLKGIERLYNGISKGFNISLMCSELNPLECHRFGMISRYISSNLKDIDIEHISKTTQEKNKNETIDDFSIITQQKLEKEILKKYMKNDGSGLELFDTNIELENAYKALNKKIGYNALTKQGDDNDHF